MEGVAKKKSIIRWTIEFLDKLVAVTFFTYIYSHNATVEHTYRFGHVYI
jgi:hypothetical protein